MTDPRVTHLYAAGLRGRALDLALLLADAQPRIEAIEFGRVSLTFHIGSNKAVLNIDQQVGARKWEVYRD